jgi:hypothetical protein
MESYESRLATFGNWSEAMEQQPCDMAEAGFFYTGKYQNLLKKY